MSDKNRPLDERYFEWLYSQVGTISNRNPARSHWILCEQLFRTVFHGWMPNDDNRAEDGKELRYEFIDKTNAKVSDDWLSIDCSILEMLIALSRKASFQSYFPDKKTPFWWFWKMLDNLELRKYVDEKYHDGIADAVTLVLNMLNHRSYELSGRGGLFPLNSPPSDQREVELWYQLSAYLLENDSPNKGD